MPVWACWTRRRRWSKSHRKKHLLAASNARTPLFIDGIVEYQPSRAITDCVWLAPMPRLTSSGMKQGFVMSLLKSRFSPHTNDLTFVGNGNSAVVYDASECCNDFLQLLLRMLTSPIVGTLVITPPIVLKFTIITGVAAYEDAVRENTVHRYLSTATCTVKGHVLSMRQRVPKFFWAGYLSGWYVTAMQRVRGESLQQRLAVAPLTSCEYDAVQRLFYDMWCMGVVHADAHQRNLVWTGGNCVILDFGNALFLPPVYVSRLKAAYMRDGHIDASDTWFAILSLYVRSVIGHRGLRGYQPDGLLLATLRPS